ncbi:histidine phosphatase family protein [Sphingomonas sp. SFZ2018-12]|uniref:SixA phosphatase family protein n=1 Tax=Sphingomonas sp. SFZ2018-12 TaxID=2683197 RepID=UPI000830D8E5|nr:histidine phosphatase family protein [Sphingomonas sp. SFZ2018-12]MCH4893840.1 histidine phosphatase family protein [Sphingomonas sp. SFZ2018-12]
MKTLTLLRHAKSGWDDPVARDFDRPLNAKGERAATTMGRHVRALGLGFDHVVASPARRVEETIAGFEAGYGATLGAVPDRRIYLASAVTLLDLVRELPADVERALLIGHNPGLEDLVLMLVPASDDDALRARVEDKFPTASLAVIAFDGAWADLKMNGGRLENFVRPRDLDPALGPDQA